MKEQEDFGQNNNYIYQVKAVFFSFLILFLTTIALVVDEHIIELF
jgi:hypothetical protein